MELDLDAVIRSPSTGRCRPDGRHDAGGQEDVALVVDADVAAADVRGR